MIQKMLRMSMIAGVICLFASQNTIAWHVQIKNDTPFSVEAKCKKVGAIGTDWHTIDPLSAGEAGCGGADCPNGVKIKVMVAFKPEKEIPQEVSGSKIPGSIPHEVIELETDWSMTCGNITVRVFLVPSYQDKKVVGFKIGLGADVDVSEVSVPA